MSEASQDIVAYLREMRGMIARADEAAEEIQRLRALVRDLLELGKDVLEYVPSQISVRPSTRDAIERLARASTP